MDTNNASPMGFPGGASGEVKWSEVAQSCPALCDPMDCSLPGSSVHGNFQAIVLEWIAISFSSAWKWTVKVKSLSHVRLSATPRAAAHQAPPSMGFSRQEYWSGLPFPYSGDLPDPGLELSSPTLQADYRLSHQRNPRILEWVAYPFSWGTSQPRN